MKHALTRRSLLGSIGALLASSSQPTMFQLSGGIEADVQDPTRLVLGPDITRTEVLAREQAAAERYAKLVKALWEEIPTALVKDIQRALDRVETDVRTAES